MSIGAFGSKLLQLPIELLLDIHFYACAPALPLTSRFLYDVFHHTSPAYKAAWLFNRLVVNASSTKKPSAKKRAAVLSAALSHPICDQNVFQLFYKRLVADGSEVKRSRVDLPKRWFKPSDDTSSATPAPVEFMQYLFNEGLANPNSHAGFPLARAVLDKNRQLIDLLLSRGACPAENNWIAISFAVKKRSLALTKELFHKRQKAEDPLACQLAKMLSSVLEDAAKARAWDIFDFFQEQGAEPNMRTALLMQQHPH